MALGRALSPVRVTCLDAFATLTAALVDVLPCLVGSHEGDGLDVWVVTDPVHSVVRPMHDAARQSRACGLESIGITRCCIHGNGV